MSKGQQSIYLRMVEALGQKWVNKSLVFCGNIKKARDLELFFKIKFTAIFDCKENILIEENDFVIFEKAYESDIVIKRYGLKYEQEYCYDEDLIDFMDNYASREFLVGNIAIWGTGGISDYFWSEYKKVNLQEHVQYYIDSNIELVGKCKNNIPIISPQEAVDKDCKIIIAVNHLNFYEIEQICRDRGIATSRYVYYTFLMNDAARMFRKTYYDNNYYNAECINRDRNIRIHGSGNIGVCCFSLEKNIMGSIYEGAFEDTWNSMQAQVCRLALMNHTFTFCDHSRCPYLVGVQDESKQADYSKEYTFVVTEYPESIAPEMDRSCNLRCTSCRHEIFVEENKEREIFLEVIKEKIVDLPTRLLVNTVGELFASKYCLDLIEDPRTIRRGNLSIYSNGTLLTPQKMDWLLQQYPKLELSISIDAATEETYSRIRRGGNYKKLMHNIEYISQLRKQNRIDYLQVNFVIQKDNIHEMQAFINQGKMWGVDRVAMDAIENWGVYTDEEYKEVSVVADGQIKPEYRKYFTDEVCKDSKVALAKFSKELKIKHTYMKMM